MISHTAYSEREPQMYKVKNKMLHSKNRHKHVKASWSNDVGWTSGFSEVFFCMRVRSETVYCPPLILLRSFIRVFALSRAHTIVGWRRSFIDDPTHD